MMKSKWQLKKKEGKQQEFFFKSPGIGRAANQRDAKSMIFALLCYRLQMAYIQRAIPKREHHVETKATHKTHSK